MNEIFSYHKAKVSYDYLDEPIPQPSDYYCHMHNDFEILFFIEGDAEYIIDGNTYPLENNTIVLIKPRVLHSLHILSQKRYVRCVFNFHETFLSNEQQQIVAQAKPIYHLETDSPICNTYRLIMQLQDIFSHSEFSVFKKSALINIVSCIKYLADDASMSSLTPENDLIPKVVKYINSHITEPLSSQMLAEYFFTSKSSIEHAFSRHFNMGLKEYINKKKILYAQKLIFSGEKSQDICAKLAFDNYITFYRNYKKFLGVSPEQDKQAFMLENKN